MDHLSLNAIDTKNKTPDPGPDPEWEWIQQAKQGNQLAFEELYRCHSGRLFSLCLHYCTTPQEAEDECQEIFIKLLKGLSKFRQESAFSTWAYRIAVNHLNRIRSPFKPKLQPIESTTLQGRRSTIQLELDLTNALASLPAKMKKVILLHDRLGFSHEEIAKITGIKASSSRSLLCRARMAMRDKLKSRGKDAT